jgi:hypothetical protein
VEGSRPAWPSAFTAICWAPQSFRKARTQEQRPQRAPRKTRRDVGIIKLSRSLHGLPARSTVCGAPPHCDSNGAARDMFHFRFSAARTAAGDANVVVADVGHRASRKTARTALAHLAERAARRELARLCRPLSPKRWSRRSPSACAFESGRHVWQPDEIHGRHNGQAPDRASDSRRLRCLEAVAARRPFDARARI